ncbi:MAG: BatA domain-containing protein [Chitinispirillaceae bacterium]|nr:BatA domain-containing protein [Chitinispirillaceae bacterium]
MNFSFFHPGFLWGLLFLAGVLLIHLLRKPRTRAILFSTVMFFPAAAVTGSRIHTLRRLLLLITRLCAVATIVALFAHPVDNRNKLGILGDPHLTVCIWIDQTPSMGYADNSKPLITSAQELTDSIRRVLPGTVRFLEWDEAQNAFVSPVTPASIRHGAPSVSQAIAVFNETPRSSRKLLLLISDFQQFPANAFETRLRDPVICVPLTAIAPWNHSVRDVRLTTTGASSRVSATIVADGKRIDRARATVSIGGIVSGSTIVSVKAGDTSRIIIDVPGARTGDGGSVSLESPDQLPFDNTGWFVHDSHSSAPVVVIGDRDNNFPLAAAFSAAGGRWNPVTQIASLDVTHDALDSAAIIAVSDIRSCRELETFLAGRSSAQPLVIFAMAADERGFGEAAMFLSNLLRLTQPLRLVNLPSPSSITLPDTLSDLWQGFRSRQISEAAVGRCADGIPGAVLLHLDNGVPFATRFVDNKNRTWVIVATPLGMSDANNLCETGFYVPLVDRLASLASGTARAYDEPWIAGLWRRNPLSGTQATATVIDGDGITIDRWESSRPEILIRQPGVYSIIRDGVRTGETPTRSMVAVNPDPAESALRYEAPAIGAAAKRFVTVLSGHQFLEAIRQQGLVTAFLPWILLGFLLLAEVLLWENKKPR